MNTQAARKIPYGRQDISAADIQSVVDVLNSDWLTQGPVIDQFEKALAKACSARYAVAVSNATAALHIACLALGLGPGDTLWTAPNTFVASANCALYCGADVDFVDIDPDTLNMSVSALAEKLAKAEQQGKLPKIVVPVHFAGQSCQMSEIKALAERYGFYIIEDASHAVGGKYQNQPVGSCQYSDMTVFSFHPVKIITTGEGGMVLTNQSMLQEKLARLRTHGITREPAHMIDPADGQWSYQQIELGYNYRITDMQAALGLSQLSRLPEFIERRHELVSKYTRELAGLSLAWQHQHSDTYSAFHLFVVRILASAKFTRLQLFEKLREAGILVNVHYIPVHLQPFYQQRGFAAGQFPEAEKYYQQAITLPLYASLNDGDQQYVIDVLRRLCG